MLDDDPVISELKDARISILRSLHYVKNGDHISILADLLADADKALETVLQIMAPRTQPHA